MKRMSGADSFMLAMETPSNYMHTLKVAILDPSTDPEGWSFEKFSRDLEARLDFIPYLRWRCAAVPLGLNHPMWVDDPDFNMDYHVRRVALPEPGDHNALCEFISSIYAYQLDRSRPLWMLWVAEGLEDGKVALVALLHHAYVDGSGAFWGLQQLYRPEPGYQPEQAPPWQPRPYPNWGKRVWWGARDWPEVILKNIPGVVRGLVRKKILDDRYRRAGKGPHPSMMKMKKTPINQALSPGRAFICHSVPLGEIKAVAKGFGMTINDVFLACAAGTVRWLLQSQDYDADQHPLVAGTPFAGKRDADSPGIGNFAKLDFCWLHSDIEDRVERLQACHDSANEMKQHQKDVVEAGADPSALIQICPPIGIKGIREFIRSQQGKLGFFGNVLLSNVRGPAETLYFNRYKLDDWFSTGQIFDGTCLNITLWSYCDRANLCILIDKCILADGWPLFERFVHELDAYKLLIPTAEPKPEPKPRSKRKNAGPRAKAVQSRRKKS